jgi:hypothetical protein
VFFPKSQDALSAFNRIVIHKKSFPEQGGEGLLTPHKASGKQKSAVQIGMDMVIPWSFQPCTALGSLIQFFTRLSACSIKSCRFNLFSYFIICVICADADGENHRTLTSALFFGNSPN